MTNETALSALPELEALIHRIYKIVSGPKTTKREWDDIRALFWPTARVISIYNLGDGKCRVRDLTVEEWIVAASARFAAEDFYERGIILDSIAAARIYLISSPYESRHEADGPVFERGVNHFSFFQDDERWWLSNLVWEVEALDRPLSAKADASLRS
jgi:hypothetical protein